MFKKAFNSAVDEEKKAGRPFLTSTVVDQALASLTAAMSSKSTNGYCSLSETQFIASFV